MFPWRNNAGIVACPYELSEDGIELQFAMNHFGQYHTRQLCQKIPVTCSIRGFALLIWPELLLLLVFFSEKCKLHQKKINAWLIRHKLLLNLTLWAGHFLLTSLLLDKMKSTASETGVQGRIINVSSVAHKRSDGTCFELKKLNDKAR